MTRNMKTITSGVVMNILATDPRPSDEMRRVILWQAGELKRLAALFKVLHDCAGADEEAAQAAEEKT